MLAGPRVHDDFVAALTEQATNTKTGAPEEEGVLYGSLNNACQLERVAGIVGRLPDHTEVRTGGRQVGERGFFYAPTVVSGLRQDDEASQSEIFGPVITVQAFTDEEEAARLANGVPYGVAPACGPTTTGGRCGWPGGWTSVACGSTLTNRYVAEMPHGGFKHSGYGTDLSIYGLEDYTRVKHVMSCFED